MTYQNLTWSEVQEWAAHPLSGAKPNARGDGYRAACPVCETRGALSVFLKRSGGVGVKCWHGCTWRDLIDTVEQVIRSAAEAPGPTAPPPAAQPAPHAGWGLLNFTPDLPPVIPAKAGIQSPPPAWITPPRTSPQRIAL